MTVTNKAIAGTYSDLKLVRSRKVAVICVEIPIEQAAAFVGAFGMPNPAEETWVALAKLNGPQKALEAPQKLREARQWDTLPSAQQSAIRCGDEAFRGFLRERWPKFGSAPLTVEEAADLVRSFCWVQSRREIKPGSDAEKRWQDLDRQFLAWQNGCVASRDDRRHG